MEIGDVGDLNVCIFCCLLVSSSCWVYFVVREGF